MWKSSFSPKSCFFLYQVFDFAFVISFAFFDDCRHSRHICHSSEKYELRRLIMRCFTVFRARNTFIGEHIEAWTFKFQQHKSPHNNRLSKYLKQTKEPVIKIFLVMALKSIMSLIEIIKLSYCLVFELFLNMINIFDRKHLFFHVFQLRFNWFFNLFCPDLCIINPPILEEKK